MRRSRASVCCRAPTLDSYLYVSRSEICRSSTSIDDRLAFRDRDHPGDDDLRRLRDFAVENPERRLLSWTIGDLHLPGAGADRQRFHHYRWVDLINTYAGIVLPLIAPVTVIVCKQFFDSLPREFREAAVMDGANDFQLLFRVFLPMNWGQLRRSASSRSSARGTISLALSGGPGRDDDDGDRRHPGGAGHVWRRLCEASGRRGVGWPAGVAGLPALSASRDQALTLSAGIKG